MLYEVITDGVVEGRGGVEQDHRSAENGAGDDMPGIAVEAGKGGEHSETGNRQEHPNAMGHAIGYFLQECIPRPDGLCLFHHCLDRAGNELFRKINGATARALFMPQAAGLEKRLFHGSRFSHNFV